MSDSTGTAAHTPAGHGPDVVHEAYSFACMRCSHAWEQTFVIEHHIDGDGRTVVTYFADGKRVPSPLSRPTCDNCEGHVVRIMQSGRVSNPDLQWPRKPVRPAAATGTPAGSGSGSGSDPATVPAAGPPARGEGRGSGRSGQGHWHLPRFFHRRHGDVA